MIVALEGESRILENSFKTRRFRASLRGRG